MRPVQVFNRIMAGFHIVKQGEHVSSIALAYGFSRHGKIWDHPENAQLKARRKNPNVLLPGDSLFIPDRDTKEHTAGTDQLHKYLLSTEPLKLCIKLERAYAQPIANTDCELRLAQEKFMVTSDAAGLVQHAIPLNATDAALLFKDFVKVKDTKLQLDRELDISIGHLNPVEEISGQQARLANLGYYRGGADQIDEVERASAIEEFQCEHGLKVDGICGPLTQAKLEQVHGC